MLPALLATVLHGLWLLAAKVNAQWNTTFHYTFNASCPLFDMRSPLDTYDKDGDTGIISGSVSYPNGSASSIDTLSELSFVGSGIVMYGALRLNASELNKLDREELALYTDPDNITLVEMSDEYLETELPGRFGGQTEGLLLNYSEPLARVFNLGVTVRSFAEMRLDNFTIGIPVRTQAYVSPYLRDR